MSIYSEKQSDKQDAAEVKNYTRTPNMLIFGYKHISPQEKWLYVSLKHLCGKKGTRHLSLRYISEQTGISTGALSSSKNAKGATNAGMMRHLHDAGLIHCEIKKHEGKGNPQYHVTITDVWALNQEFFLTRSDFGQDTEEKINLSERLTSPSEFRTDTPSTRPNFGQTCPNSGTNIRLDNKTTITDKITEQDKSIVDVATQIDAPSPLSVLLESWRQETTKQQQETLQVLIDAGIVPKSENDSHITSPEESETSLQPANSTTLSEYPVLPPESPKIATEQEKADHSTHVPENVSQVAKQQENGEIRIAALQEVIPQKLLDVPLGPPTMPPDNAKWCAETMVQIVETSLQRRFSEKISVNSKKQKTSPRQRQLVAAKKILDEKITRDDFVRAYEDTAQWWSIGPLSVVEMAAISKTSGLMRTIDVVEKLKFSSSKKVLQFPGTTSQVNTSPYPDPNVIVSRPNLEKFEALLAAGTPEFIELTKEEINRLKGGNRKTYFQMLYAQQVAARA